MGDRILIESQFLPPIPILRKCYQYETLLIESQENYQKRSFRNRIIICGPQGVKSFSIPLSKGKHEALAIQNVKIAYDEDWISQFIKLCTASYRNAPYYAFYIDELTSILNQKYEYIYKLNMNLLKWVCSKIEMRIDIEVTDVYKLKYNIGTGIIDLRNHYRPSTIQHVTPTTKYRQVYEGENGFMPNLSILDMLMCCGPEIPMYFTNHFL